MYPEEMYSNLYTRKKSWIARGSDEISAKITVAKSALLSRAIATPTGSAPLSYRLDNSTKELQGEPVNPRKSQHEPPAAQ